MDYVVAVLAVAAFASWLLALVSFILALGHRAEGVTLGSLLLNGFKNFDSRSFTALGQRHRRRFLLGFALFFLCLFAGVGVAVLRAS